MNIQHTEKTNRTLIFAIVACIAGIIMGFAIGAVYGVELPPTYNETVALMNVTAEDIDGNLINHYVADVKKDICETLNANQTAKQECLNL